MSGGNITESSTLLSINTNLSDDSSDNEINTSTINKSEISKEEENQKDGIIINFDDESVSKLTPGSQLGMNTDTQNYSTTTLKNNNPNSGDDTSSSVLIDPMIQ